MWRRATTTYQFVNIRWDFSRPYAWDTMRHHYCQFVIWKRRRKKFQLKLIFQTQKYLRIIFYCFERRLRMIYDQVAAISTHISWSSSIVTLFVRHNNKPNPAEAKSKEEAQQFVRQFTKHTNISAQQCMHDDDDEQHFQEMEGMSESMEKRREENNWFLLQ